MTTTSHDDYDDCADLEAQALERACMRGTFRLYDGGYISVHTERAVPLFVQEQIKTLMSIAAKLIELDKFDTSESRTQNNG